MCYTSYLMVYEKGEKKNLFIGSKYAIFQVTWIFVHYCIVKNNQQKISCSILLPDLL